jgi:glutaminyl-tRNA synthetase
MLEPSMAGAAPGSHWQLERLGYFVADVVDSRPGAPVLNRTVTLRDSWQGGAEDADARADAAAAATGTGIRERSAKASTRPAKRSRVEYRAEARSRDPLLAARFAEWPHVHGISEADADLLTGDVPTGDLFETAVRAGAPAPAVARWIVNELPPALGGRDLAGTPLTGSGLAALVLAVESGAVSAQAGRDVFAEMVERGGEPGEIIARRGLTQLSDEAAMAAIVDDVVAANSDKVAQYRGGKTALLGFFVGQVVKASDGRANPKVAQKMLAERLR